MTALSNGSEYIGTGSRSRGWAQALFLFGVGGCGRLGGGCLSEDAG